ncbi:choice-of-anchor J domain-containing protein [Formosa sp. A9]|uniref:choice-of-anchor J domain-containing protein n=1 Tax=Formosa sp. A9 TaxID=3442641 RepID=UPI003EB9D4DF
MKNYYLLVAVFVMSFWQTFAQCDYSENFEEISNNQVPENWTLINTTGVTAAVYANVQNVNGSRRLRMYNNTAYFGEGSTIPENSVLMSVLPGQDATLFDGNHRLSFTVVGTENATFTVGTITTNTEDAVFTAIEENILVNSSSESTTIRVMVPSTTDRYIAIKHDLGARAQQINFDDFCIEVLPTCLEVSNITLDTFDAHSVSFSWDASASGESKWQTAVLTTNEGDPVSGILDVEDATTHTVDGLDANTVYYVFVRAYCGEADGYGAWQGPVPFRTACDVEPGEFCQDFEDDSYASGDIPMCWEAIDGYNGRSFGISKSSYSAFEGDYYFTLSIASTATAKDAMLISAESSVATDGNHRVVFMAKGSSAEAGIIVGTITDPADASTFTAVDTIYPGNTAYKEIRVTLPDNADGYFAFKRTNEVNNSSVYLDNICLQTLPSCLEVEDIAVSNVTATSADVSWTTSASAETAWEYLVQEMGAEAPTAETSGVAVNGEATVSITEGLDPNTNYSVYVRANCGETDGFSAWEGPIDFLTLCSAFEAPFADSFESGSANQDIQPCWTSVLPSGGNMRTVSGGGIIPAPHDGALAVRFYGANLTTEMYLISPELSDLSADKTIKFAFYDESTAEDEDEVFLEIGTVSSPEQYETFTLLSTVSSNDIEYNNEWQDVEVNLENYTGDDTFLVIKYVKPTGKTRAVLIDEFSYEVNESLSIAQPEFESLKLYPNPTQNILNVAGAKINSVSIYTINGQKINATLNNNQVDVSNLQSGFYFLEMTTENGAVGRQKFIKK